MIGELFADDAAHVVEVKRDLSLVGCVVVVDGHVLHSPLHLVAVCIGSDSTANINITTTANIITATITANNTTWINHDSGTKQRQHLQKNLTQFQLIESVVFEAVYGGQLGVQTLAGFGQLQLR